MSSEEVYTAREVAATLGLAGAMLRRYATEYEAVAGSEITVHKREGRLFDSEQVAVLQKARALVSEQGLSVRAAMQIALGKDDSTIGLRHAESRFKALQGEQVGIDTLALSDAFREALKDAVRDGNKELLEEVRKLNANLSITKYTEQTGTIENPSPKSEVNHFLEEATEASKPHEHGVFVRFAFWVEKVVFRR